LHMIIATFVSFFLTVSIYKAHKNTQDIKVNHIQLPPKTTSDFTESLSILHLSDLHMENISLTLEQLAANLANKQADGIALSGDFVDLIRKIPQLRRTLQYLN